MEILNSGQGSCENIQDKHFDLIIAASGIGSKCISLIDNLNITADKKIILNHTGKLYESRPKKNNIISASDLVPVLNFPLNKFAELISFFNDLFDSYKKDALDLFIDISFMNINWLAAVFNFFTNYNSVARLISVYFHTPTSEYFQQKKVKFGLSASSLIHQFNKLSDNTNPRALIIDLSLEAEKAEFIIKKLKPAQLFLMYADPAFNIPYAETVLKNNRSIIDTVEMRNLYNYPFNEPEFIYDKLKSLCLSLRLNYRVIIACLGINFFSLSSLLINSVYPDIDVWTVKSVNQQSVHYNDESADPIIYKVTFINDDIVA